MRINFDIKVSFSSDEFQELADAVEFYTDEHPALTDEEVDSYEKLRLKCLSLSVLLESQKKDSEEVRLNAGEKNHKKE